MPKPKTKAKRRSAESQASARGQILKTVDAARSERRFAPDAGAMSVLPIVASSAGALLLGAGVFGQFLRAIPHPYALHMLGVGVVLLLVGLAMGARSRPAIRVGDAGVGVERSDEQIERLGWNEIDAIRLASGVLSFSGSAKLVTIDLAENPGAAALALAEARRRLPVRVKDIDENVNAKGDVGELIVLEPFQAAGLRCKATDRLLSMERDARVCGLCGEVYHKESVPDHCLSCDADLTG